MVKPLLRLALAFTVGAFVAGERNVKSAKSKVRRSKHERLAELSKELTEVNSRSGLSKDEQLAEFKDVARHFQEVAVSADGSIGLSDTAGESSGGVGEVAEERAKAWLEGGGEGSAAQVLNNWSEQDVAYFFVRMGNKALGKAIADAHIKGPQLLELAKVYAADESVSANATAVKIVPKTVTSAELGMSETVWQAMRLELWSFGHDQTEIAEQRVAAWLWGSGQGDAGEVLKDWGGQEVESFLEKRLSKFTANELAKQITGLQLLELAKVFGAVVTLPAAEGVEARSVTNADFGMTKLDWKGMRLELWSLAHESRDNKVRGWAEVAAEQEPTAVKACSSVCRTFDLMHTYGWEWALLPVPTPWPNPIHTWICQPNEYSEVVDKLPKEKETDGAVKNLTMVERVGNTFSKLFNGFVKMVNSNSITRGAANVVNYFARALVTLMKCASCGLCILWAAIKAKLAQFAAWVGEKKRSITRSASGSQKAEYLKMHAEMGGRLRTSLVEAFSSSGFGSKETFAPAPSMDAFHTLPPHIDSDEAYFEHVEKIMKMTFSVVDRAEAASYDQVEMQLQRMATPPRERPPRQSRFYPANVSASLLEGDEAVHKIPEKCQKMLDPVTGNLKRYRTAFIWALNVEMPNLGDAAASLMVGNFAGAISAILPELLIMVIPQKKEFGDCISAPEEAKMEAAMTCTPRHIGMCTVAMKKQMLTEMVEAEWPPLEAPTWWKRGEIMKALDLAVYSTCLGDEHARFWSKRDTKITKAKDGTSLTDAQIANNVEYQDCLMIKDKVHKFDYDADRVARYSPKIWFAAVQAWFKQEVMKAKTDSGTVLDANLLAKSDPPNIDAFILQFCSDLVTCNKAGSSDATPEAQRWPALLAMFEGSGDDDLLEYGQKRLQMYDYWGDKQNKLLAEFATDDSRGINELQSVYQKSIRPLFIDNIDVRHDPFHQASATSPTLVQIKWKDVDAQGLLVPPVAWSTLLVRAGLKIADDYWMWLETNIEQGCPQLHMFLDKKHAASKKGCANECASSAGAGHPATEEGKMSFVKCVMGVPLVPGETPDPLCPTPRNLAKECQECLQYRKWYIVDCQKNQEFPLYSMKHQNQKDGMSGNKVYYIDTMLFSPGDSHMLSADFKKARISRAFISPDWKAYPNDNKRWSWADQTFQAISNSGKCSCMCDGVADYMEGKPCRDSRLTKEGQSPDQECLPQGSSLPGAICCKNGAEMIDSTPLKYVIDNFGCITNMPFPNAEAMCKAMDLELCGNLVVTHLLGRLQKTSDTIYWKNLQAKLKETVAAADAPAVGTALQQRQSSWTTCLSVPKLPKAPGSAEPEPALFRNQQSRVWLPRDPAKASSKYQLNEGGLKETEGPFQSDFDYCLDDQTNRYLSEASVTTGEDSEPVVESTDV